MKATIIAGALLSALGFAACGRQEKAAPEPTIEEPSQDAPGTDTPTGWLEADGAGETAAVYRAGASAVEFSLTCSQVEKTLTILAEAPTTNLPPDSAATFSAGAAAFSGTANAVEDSVQAEMVLPLTPVLLKALSNAKSARLTIGGASTTTGPDEKQALAHLSQSCSIITGVKPD
jgi:hypothetical protein